MTTIKCHYKDSHIQSVLIKGHVEYSNTEYDMVCASISAISQTALLGLKNVVKVDPKYKIAEGYLKIELSDLDNDKRKQASLILDTMMEGLRDIAKGYSSYIKLEEEGNVY